MNGVQIIVHSFLQALIAISSPSYVQILVSF
jgi:hypothetical protein